MMWQSKEQLENKKILIDSDVIRHFIKGKALDKLKEIFPNQILLLDMVEEEVCRSKTIKPKVQALIKDGTFRRVKFPTSTKFITEYLQLQVSNDGPGENSCLVYARFKNDIIASNNLTDTKPYCETHDVLYMTTLDILYYAYWKGVMSEADVDFFLYNNCIIFKFY